MSATPSPEPSKINVFLSYSRPDKAFLSRLAEALDARGYKAIFDQSEKSQPDDPDLVLAAQDEWWSQLKAMIAASDVLVFVVSPESAKSRVCDDEIAHAKNLGKRVVPVLRRAIDFSTAPERLRALNVKFSFEVDEASVFDAALDALCAELDLDIEWHRSGARLMRQAERWDRDGQPEAQLLRSGAVDEADAWAARRPLSAPAPGPLLLAFLQASRRFEADQRDRQRRLIGRAFVKPSRQAFEGGAHEHALRLAAAGALLADDLNMEIVPELWSRAAPAIMRNRTRAICSGHTAVIFAAEYSGDGRRIVTAGGGDQTARVWDSETGQEIALLKHPDTVDHAGFSPDGQMIASICRDRTVRIWAAADATGRAWGEAAIAKGHGANVFSFSFSPDSRHLVTAGSKDKTARVWDTKNGQEIARFDHLGEVGEAVFSPDGRHIVTASSEAVAWVFEWPSAKAIARLNHPASVSRTSFSPDGKLIVTVADHDVRVWQVEGARELALLRHANMAHTAVFSSNGRRVLTTSSAIEDGLAHVWDWEPAQEIARTKSDWVASAKFSPDGRRILTCTGWAASLWDAEDGAAIGALIGHEAGLNVAAFSPDGRHILTASDDGTARVWSAESSNEIAVFLGHPYDVKSAAISPDGRWVATGSDDAVRIWEAGTGQEVLRLEDRAVECVAFSPEGLRLVTSSKNETAQIWDLASGKEMVRLVGHTEWVTSASFSPDGRYVLTASRDLTARVWDPHTGNEIACLSSLVGARETSEDLSMMYMVGAAFSPDGERIVTAFGDLGVRVWDWKNLKEIASLAGHTKWVARAAFSPDGRLIVTASHDGTARVWDWERGVEVVWLGGHKLQVWDATFSPDGRRIVTASNDEARIWDAETGVQIAALKQAGPMWSAAFSPDGAKVLTTPSNSAKLWDVSRTMALVMAPKAHVLAAALANGLGRRTENETSDLLMQDAPADMYAEAMARLGAERAAEVADLTNVLRVPLDPNCYLSPTQFGELFPAAPNETPAEAPIAFEGAQKETSAPARSAMEASDPSFFADSGSQKLGTPKLVAPLLIRKGVHPALVLFLALLAALVAVIGMVLLERFDLAPWR